MCLHLVPRLGVHGVEVSYQCVISGSMCVTPHSLNYCISPYSPFIKAALQIPEWRTSRKLRLNLLYRTCVTGILDVGIPL